jgi:hypothetical protein
MSGCGLSPEEQARRDKETARREVELKSNYKVTVIDNAGAVLREWKSIEYVDIHHGVAVFTDAITGRRIKVGGNFIVEQL